MSMHQTIEYYDHHTNLFKVLISRVRLTTWMKYKIEYDILLHYLSKESLIISQLESLKIYTKSKIRQIQLNFYRNPI